jgi:hypothetical protein
MRRAVVVVFLLCLHGVPARAQPAAPAVAEVEAGNNSDGYTPPSDSAGAGPGPVQLNGYVDVGFADAGGDGTSFAPADTRVPADYGADAFAPAVNSRGDVASTDAGPRFTNGFLPRSVGIGGRPSFLLNTASVDLKYSAVGAPVMIFTRLQLLPRFNGAGDETRPVLEQAFGRIVPFDSHELALSAGKFDSVFGIEYLENQANIRVGITPSLLARYTTGQGIGAKVFYRLQLAPLWSAVSLNVSATNSGHAAPVLQPTSASLSGVPVVAARLGYELNLARLQIKVGGSVMVGPRNDQNRSDARQTTWGADARVALGGLYLSGEYVRVDKDEGGPKTTPLGAFPLSSAFSARGFWGQASYTLALDLGPVRRLTGYGRYEQRRAWFLGFTTVEVDRLTAGVRADLWETVIVKAEVLVNRERSGAPDVDNNVRTASVVYTW